MRSLSTNLAVPLLLILSGAACLRPKDDGKGGGEGGAGADNPGGHGGMGGAGGGGAEGGSAGAGQPGWTVMPLLPDPNNPAPELWQSAVAGIYFASLDDGYVVTTPQAMPAEASIYRARQKELTSLVLSGALAAANGEVCGDTLDLNGIAPTDDGYVAFGPVCRNIASADGGATFHIEVMGTGLETLGGNVLGLKKTLDGSLLVRSGQVLKATTAPGAATMWTEVWGPVPPNEEVPDGCINPPGDSGNPTNSQQVYISDDLQTVAYASSSFADSSPEICLSTDGGDTFYPKKLGSVAEPDLTETRPSGLYFIDDTTAVTWSSHTVNADKMYLYRSTDGGNTWQKLAFPAELQGKRMDLTEAFFAPGGNVGYLVGFDWEDELPVLMKTTDAGATWVDSSAPLREVITQANGALGDGRLVTGFALDENRIWVGGKEGFMAANEAGGE